VATNKALVATHEMAVVADKLKVHPYAPQVLKAFGLEVLSNKSFIIGISERVVIPNVDPSIPFLRELIQHLRPIWAKWTLFTECIEPIENLTVPKEITSEQDFDEILTIELKYEGRIQPQAETISKVLVNVTKLYEAVAVASGHKEFDPLIMIYATSGSSFRFDFKGLGDPLKQVKEILVEAWKRIRHRKADDFHQNSKAILEGLNLLSQVRSHSRQNVMDAETTMRLNQKIISSMLGLFEEGALPREVRSIEIVSNDKLIQGIQQKLLPPSSVEIKGGKTKKRRSNPKKTSPKRGKAKLPTKPLD
jgi:hypothetical protein